MKRKLQALARKFRNKSAGHSRREKRLIEAIRYLMGIDGSAHNGYPPSWDKSCSRCARVNEIKSLIGDL